jgi:CubicO group peptidase (beta-lactamase class C family)
VLRAIAPRNVDNIAPAAALYSSSSDLARWLLLLLGRGEIDGRRVLDARVIDTLLTPQTLVGLAPWQQTLYPKSHVLAQGMGLMLQDHHGHWVAWGTGGIDGYACSMALVPKAQLGVVVLTNVPWTGLPEGMVFWLLDRFLATGDKDWCAVRLALSLQPGLCRRRSLSERITRPCWAMPSSNRIPVPQRKRVRPR